ncbi:MAG: hypothetical protein GY875_22900 [Gammaproteobacteria bacterium]|nr:hypothetical protein [Gammaproteobacteria bacterium]
MKRMISLLPRELADRYGASDFYTPGQVSKTLEAKDYSMEFERYALVIFVDPDICQAELISPESYESLRKEIAARYFDGNFNFVAQLVKERSVGNAGFSTYGNIQEASALRPR